MAESSSMFIAYPLKITSRNNRTKVLGQKSDKFMKQKTQEKAEEPDELNKYLCEFILSVKRKDGENCEPSSPRGLFSSVYSRFSVKFANLL